MNNRTKQALIRDLQEWWDDNKKQVIPEELEKIEFFENRNPADCVITEYSGESDENDEIEGLEVTDFVNEFAEKLFTGLINLIKTTEAK